MSRSSDQVISLWELRPKEIIWNACSQVYVLQSVLLPKLSLNTQILQFFSYLAPPALSFPYYLNPLPSLGGKGPPSLEEKKQSRPMQSSLWRSGKEWDTYLLRQLKKKTITCLIGENGSQDSSCPEHKDTLPDAPLPSLTQQILIKHLLGARCCPGCYDIVSSGGRQ